MVDSDIIDKNSLKSQKKLDIDTDFFDIKIPTINEWDIKIVREIYHKHNNSKMRDLAKYISFTGDPRLWVCILAFFFIEGIFQQNFSFLVIFLTGFLQTFGLYYLIKNLVKRKRPFLKLKDIVRLDKTGHGYSFPSGHCHHSTLLYGLICLNFLSYPWMLIPLIIYNCLIAYSRLILGCHYPSDVLFGTIEAYLELIFFWLITKYWYLQLYDYIISLIF